MADAQLTKIVLEQWLAPSPDAQMTQVAVEVWGNASDAGRFAVMTQLAAEMWASVVLPVAPSKQTFVTINVG